MIREFWYSFSQNRGAVIGLVLVAIFTFIAIFAPWLAPHDPTILHEGMFTHPPVWNEAGTWEYPLGTDDVGRDLLSRLIYGAQVSMTVGFMVVVFSLSIGVLLGLIAGYAGG